MRPRFAKLPAAVALILVLGAGVPAVAPSTQLAIAAPPPDALTATRFSLTIDGVEIAAFSDLEQVTSQVASIGGGKLGTVVLRRGLNRSMEMWAWHEAVLMGDIVAARKSASLVMYASDGKPVARYYLENAWPSKIEIGALKAGVSEVLMETVTIVCEKIQRVSI
jgi:phage tail-like protein